MEKTIPSMLGTFAAAYGIIIGVGGLYFGPS